jgi:hypothetical protein
VTSWANATDGVAAIATDAAVPSSTSRRDNPESSGFRMHQSFVTSVTSFEDRERFRLTTPTVIQSCGHSTSRDADHVPTAFSECNNIGLGLEIRMQL